jgi:hypothetical protein
VLLGTRDLISDLFENLHEGFKNVTRAKLQHWESLLDRPRTFLDRVRDEEDDEKTLLARLLTKKNWTSLFDSDEDKTHSVESLFDSDEDKTLLLAHLLAKKNWTGLFDSDEDKTHIAESLFDSDEDKTLLLAHLLAKKNWTGLFDSDEDKTHSSKWDDLLDRTPMDDPYHGGFFGRRLLQAPAVDDHDKSVLLLHYLLGKKNSSEWVDTLGRGGIDLNPFDDDKTLLLMHLLKNVSGFADGFTTGLFDGKLDLFDNDKTFLLHALLKKNKTSLLDNLLGLDNDFSAGHSKWGDLFDDSPQTKSFALLHSLKKNLTSLDGFFDGIMAKQGAEQEDAEGGLDLGRRIRGGK